MPRPDLRDRTCAQVVAVVCFDMLCAQLELLAHGDGVTHWTHIRLAAGDVGPAVMALAFALGPVNVRVDPTMPTPAPWVEWELQVEGYREPRVARILRGCGIEVLAARERIAEGMQEVGDA